MNQCAWILLYKSSESPHWKTQIHLIKISILCSTDKFDICFPMIQFCPFILIRIHFNCFYNYSTSVSLGFFWHCYITNIKVSIQLSPDPVNFFCSKEQLNGVGGEKYLLSIHQIYMATQLTQSDLKLCTAIESHNLKLQNFPTCSPLKQQQTQFKKPLDWLHPQD